MEELLKLFKKREENFKLLANQKENIELASKIIIKAINNGSKLLFCANGGSASDCNHIACEFIAKFKKKRKSYPAISLCSNNSIITAIANDYSFDDIFCRQIEGLAKSEDVLIAISTSAKSKNVLKAIEQAKKQGLKVIFLTGDKKTAKGADVIINAPSKTTCEIQEIHLAILHIICEVVENELCKNIKK